MEHFRLNMAGETRKRSENVCSLILSSYPRACPGGLIRTPNRPLFKVITILAIAASLTLVAGAWAVTVQVDPADVTAVASSVNYQLEAVYSCDGSGLTGDLHTNQISIGAEPPEPGEGTMWLSNGVAGEWIKYEFDSVYSLSRMWVWNYNQVVSDGSSRTERGINNCEIEYSVDGTDWFQLGTTHALARADGTDSYAHNTEIDFGGVAAKNVRITVISNHGGSAAGLSEVRFFAESDMSFVSFETAASGNPEFMTLAEADVTLTPASESVVSVNYSVAGGTATAGADYSIPGTCYFDFNSDGEIDFRDLNHLAQDWLEAGPGGGVGFLADGMVDFKDYSVLAFEWQQQGCSSSVVVFEPGETRRPIYLGVVDDGAYNEDDETVVLGLSNPSEGIGLLEPSNHTYTIIDSPPTVSFETDSSMTLEDNGALMRLPVNLSHAGMEAVSVEVAVIGGTAQPGGVDYLMPAGLVSFSPGQTAGYIDIRIRADNLIEVNETIELELFNPVNMQFGPFDRHVVTIIDDEVGVWFDNMRWISSVDRSMLDVDEQGRFTWYVEKNEQVIVHFDPIPISNSGDVVEFKYILHSSADADPSCECYTDLDPDPDIYQFCDGGVLCVGGTGDFRMGLFDSRGQHIDRDNMGCTNPRFNGYRGFNFQVFPHVSQDAPRRWDEPKADGGSEAHTNTSIWFRSDPTGNDAILSNRNTYNRILDPQRGGFGIPVDGSALMILRLERSGSSIEADIYCNGKWWGTGRASGDNLPTSIDTFAIWNNGGPYHYLKFEKP